MTEVGSSDGSDADPDQAGLPAETGGLGQPGEATQPDRPVEQASPGEVEESASGRVDTGNIEPTGRFRIYLGAAAGVGKTCAMLDEGWRRHNRGTDVVIGYVETHNRPFTAEMIRDLEVVPRQIVNYRGSRFEEMDTEAVIARRPQVALIDELAHTNVPGSGGSEKRWEDVLRILDAGIGVISTVNVQHLESIAEAVEHMTGSQVRERVPDWVVRKADQLELIDSSPEQLRRRMAHGNVYPPEKIQAALSNFFRTDNLSALRELALRFVADETDEALIERLRQRGTPDIWETTERILVGVDSTPGTDSVVRRAARLANRLKGDLHVLHVVSSESVAPRDAAGLAALRQLTEDVGGDWFELKADEPAKAITKFAMEHQITQIVLGASRRSRWEELTRGSIVARVIRLASTLDVDVHVIARRELPRRASSDAPDE
jgi:two-component system sensor histidine kinase KdpD